MAALGAAVAADARADAGAVAPPEVEVVVRAEQPGARHEPGELIRFTVEVRFSGLPADHGSLTYTLSDDGYAPLESESLPLTGKPLVLPGKLERPGFLRCEVQAVRPNGEPIPGAKAVAAAAVAPDRITPSRETPVDFDDFWSEQKQRLAAVPLEAELTSLTSAGQEDVPEGIALHDVKVRAEGEWPVSGYLARPAEAAARSLPAVLWTHGAGVRSASAAKAISGAREGFLSFDINAHGIDNGRPAEYYRHLETEGRLKDYRSQGLQNRDGVYFRGMYLRLVRAIDFLSAQPEWDGRVMAVIGHSQGGGQALVAGGLDPRVTFVGAGVPALCDHTGMARRRISGWPKMVPILPDGRPDPVIAEVARYYDAVNFSARCKADAVVSVGFLDATCPPTSCYAAINRLRGRVEILNEPEMAHAAPETVQEAFLAALREHVAKRQAAQPDELH